MKTILAITAVTLAISACSGKPPGCGDEKAMDAVKNLIKNEVLAGLTGGREYQLDQDPITAFMEDLKITLSMITTDGYNEQAKKHSCHGQLAISMGTANNKYDIDYSTQVTQDKSRDFLVQVDGGKFIIAEVKSAGLTNWLDQRFLGSWQGSYDCKALDGDESGNKAGFSQDVTMTVAPGTKASLNRTTRGGGVEELSGYISPSGLLQRKGPGRNTPDDTWMTTFEGDVKSGGLIASGRITDPLGARVLRKCQLLLTRKKNP